MNDFTLACISAGDDWQEVLARFWREIEQLPPMQRTAYLLNLTDVEMRLFWLSGIASIRQIGKALQLTNEQFNRAWVLLEWNESQRERAQKLSSYDEKFAALWPKLPLSDLTIASLLETTQQNVARLRRAAHKQLSLKLKSKEERPLAQRKSLGK